MSLLRTLKEQNVRLPRFDQPDIYENLVITGISTERRKKSDGSYMDSLFFLKLAQYNQETGEKIREEDFAFWPVKHDKGGNNFEWYASNTATTLLEFLECYYPAEQLEASFDPFTPLGLNENNYQQDVKKILGKKQNMEVFNGLMRDQFVAHVQQLIPNPDYNQPIRIKTIPSSDGKRVGLADQFWVEPMAVAKDNSRLQMTQRDQDLIMKWKALKTGTPAVGAQNPMAAAMTNPSGMPNIPGANIPGVNPNAMPQGNNPAPKVDSMPQNQAQVSPQQTTSAPTTGQPTNPIAQQQPANPVPTQPVQTQSPEISQTTNPAAPNVQTTQQNPNAGAPIPGFPQDPGNQEMPQINFDADQQKPF